LFDGYPVSGCFLAGFYKRFIFVVGQTYIQFGSPKRSFQELSTLKYPDTIIRKPLESLIPYARNARQHFIITDMASKPRIRRL
jgi:hypothetical protein